MINSDSRNLVVLRDIYSEESPYLLCPLPIIKADCLIQIVSDMNLAGYLLTQLQRKFERYYKTTVLCERVASFLNFVPGDLEITWTVEGSCLHNFISVAKLHLIYFIKKSTTAWPSGLIGRWICNPEVPSSNPSPCFLMDLQLLHALLSSQLVSLLLVGILSKFQFNLQYC